jgi:VCBS repeat protein
MRLRWAGVLILAWAELAVGQSRPADMPFRVHPIDPGASETAVVVDINRDGRLDIVSGEHWYEAPQRAVRESSASAWKKHRFRELGFSNNYIDAFSDLALDVDGDGYPDIATVTWFARKISWYRNPGNVPRSVTPAAAPWAETVINAGFNVEFAVLADIDNDGRAREIVAQENSTGQSWYEVRDGKWVKHVISDRSYGHGIGAGDVNGDKRNDILTPRGWLEAPADPRAPGWTYHAAWESANTPITPRDTPPALKPGAPPRIAELGFMHVMDVNGDGRNDMITAAGHDYGVYWFEQGPDGQWTRRTIDNAWSQGHTSTLIDLNGDGRLDFVTGKRFMAHNGADPGEREPLGVYWYEFRPASAASGMGAASVRQAAAGAEWIRHVIEYGGRVGAGMQLPVVDIDGDGDLDLVCPGKSGLFLLENLAKNTAARPATR